MNKAVSVGIHVPGVSVTGLEGGQVYGEFFRAVEAFGLDAIWVEDRIFHPAPLADAMTLLTWAAASTQRVTLGTAVMVLNLHSAPTVARQVSTLQHLSNGRVVLGVSVGGRPEEYQALAVPMDKRVGVFRESVSVLRALAGGGPVDHAGSYFDLAGAVVRPAADVPLLIGGLAEGAIRRAGELGDGWIMAPFGDLSDFERGWAIAREGAEAAGKDPDKLVAGRLIYVAVDDNREHARAEMAAFLHGYYGPDLDVDKHAIMGPAAEVAARLREQVDAGISHLMLGVPSLDHGQLRRIAEDVAPVLRA